MRSYLSAYLDGTHVVMALLIEIGTQSGTIRYNTSDWTIEWAGFTWFAGDRVISIKEADEDLTGAVNGCIVTIGSLDPATTSLALSETIEGKVGAIYRILFVPSTMAIGEVVKEFSGRISNLILTKAGQGSGGG